jgi:formate dehydrogenase major subunit
MQRDPAPFFAVEWAPPIDELSDEFPVRLTTGRRLDGYNTGVQSGGYRSPISHGAVIDLDPLDAAQLGVSDGDVVRVTSRRGSIDIPARVHDGLRPGLAFMPVHFPDDADVNILTLDAWDPKSGTAEFKATAVRIDSIVGAG